MTEEKETKKKRTRKVKDKKETPAVVSQTEKTEAVIPEQTGEQKDAVASVAQTPETKPIPEQTAPEVSEKMQEQGMRMSGAPVVAVEKEKEVQIPTGDQTGMEGESVETKGETEEKSASQLSENSKSVESKEVVQVKSTDGKPEGEQKPDSDSKWFDETLAEYSRMVDEDTQRQAESLKTEEQQQIKTIKDLLDNLEKAQKEADQKDAKYQKKLQNREFVRGLGDVLSAITNLVGVGGVKVKGKNRVSAEQQIPDSTSGLRSKIQDIMDKRKLRDEKGVEKRLELQDAINKLPAEYQKKLANIMDTASKSKSDFWADIMKERARGKARGTDASSRYAIELLKWQKRLEVEAKKGENRLGLEKVKGANTMNLNKAKAQWAKDLEMYKAGNAMGLEQLRGANRIELEKIRAKARKAAADAIAKAKKSSTGGDKNLIPVAYPDATGVIQTVNVNKDAYEAMLLYIFPEIYEEVQNTAPDSIALALAEMADSPDEQKAFVNQFAYGTDIYREALLAIAGSGAQPETEPETETETQSEAGGTGSAFDDFQ